MTQIHPLFYRDSLLNTLELLQDQNLIFYFNPIKIEEKYSWQSILPGKGNSLCVHLTWPNHNPGSHNVGKNFGTFTQYFSLISTRAFNCILNDGSIIRFSFYFADSFLLSHSLLYWPCPYNISPEDLAIFSIDDLIELNEDIKVSESSFRSPLRFDYDLSNNNSYHPGCHLHMQTGATRIPMRSPISFNRFVTFIYQHFYPEEYSRGSFWDDLEDEFTGSGIIIPQSHFKNLCITWD
ncbi:DUF2290 domain-containing protein [Oceanidesulfovibrio marinus]|uniref:DUF2290 domain-containing protein n=1 Tax=Oceanidesulfovibrio marinus TaxID=370038 RepID=A0A6P1Z9T0_9BACT|nr:DUF2290 domain-containing protein [Oceanidesulfovibrio marinus]TVM30216.1 hypothetical protein DQK91_21440 [Oceanidesulfovibrio marinus]